MEDGGVGSASFYAHHRSLSGHKDCTVMPSDVPNTLDDEHGMCRQCGHPFNPHVLIAHDPEHVDKGGIIRCPVPDCKCFHTWDFKPKKE